MHVHVLSYDILMGMKMVHVWKTSNLGEGGGYHDSMTSVTRIPYHFHVWWCTLWATLYVSHTIQMRTICTIISVIDEKWWGNHTIATVQGSLHYETNNIPSNNVSCSCHFITYSRYWLYMKDWVQEIEVQNTSFNGPRFWTQNLYPSSKFGFMEYFLQSRLTHFGKQVIPQ